MGKNNLIKKIIVLAVVMLFIFPLASAAVNFCCEKTLSGAWCQNAERENCDENFKITPTSCDSTSYCKRGCCYDSEEGLCMENTPQKVCDESGGAWKDSASCAIPQCELGCCILGDQAALVTMTRCLSLSSFYSVETNFQADITDELTCIATANSQDRGACVFDDPQMHVLTCKFTTRAECNAQEGQLGENATGKAFYKDILCSAKGLGTRCAKTKQTMIIEGRDEIYYKDLCGNPANIYDASKYDDDEYWTKVYTKENSCNPGESNAGSKTCGNCNYFLGSMARKTSIGTGSATYGDYICIDLNCGGKRHGESWCVSDSEGGDGKDKAGSRYYKQICLNGKVLVEPCADFRNEICLSTTIEGFSEASCVVNRWQDCISQDEEKDCLNTDSRDCRWLAGYYFSSSEGGGAEVHKSILDKTPSGLCVPNYPAGFNFWGNDNSVAATAGSSGEVAEGAQRFSGPTGVQFGATTSPFGTGAVQPKASIESTDVCGFANSAFEVNFERKVKALGEKEDWVCKGIIKSEDGSMDNSICQYFTKDELTNPAGFAEEMNKICSAIGDCGYKSNWVGRTTDDGYAVYWRDKRVAGSGGGETLEKPKETATTGKVIAEFLKDTYGRLGGND